MRASFSNLEVINHPLIQDRLTKLREKDTDTASFRRLLREIAVLMTYEVTRDLEVQDTKIQTPVTAMQSKILAHPEPVIIPILRAGLGMSDGVADVLSNAVFGHIGVYRDEQTHRPHEYLVRLPKNIENSDVILVDPMLATGYSAKYALDILVRAGVDIKNIKFMVLVGAPEGVRLLEEAYPELRIYAAALDEKLNENAFIVPGLGDAGDRVFGTI